MIRLLLATTFLLGSCAGTTDLAVRLAREVAVLQAAVDEFESRLAAVAAAARDHRADEPPRSTAGRRREDHAPAPAPGGASGQATPATPETPPAPVLADTPVAIPASQSAPASPSVPVEPVVDPVRELARTVSELRARMERERVPSDAIPSGAGTGVPPPPAERSVPRPSAAREGRFQIAGHGESAWQTVLDTHTGVVHNFRIVDGESRWVPITRAIGR